jgi:hypothetical protein
LSENVHRTTRRYITQNTNLIISKINKLHSGDFRRHRLQLCVSLSEMVREKRHGSAASGSESDRSKTVTATYFICTMPVEPCIHGAMFCIYPFSLLSMFLFSISLAEFKQNQDQSELNFIGYAIIRNCEERIESIGYNNMVCTCNCLSCSWRMLNMRQIIHLSVM